jgi:hypothetical protein
MNNRGLKISAMNLTSAIEEFEKHAQAVAVPASNDTLNPSTMKAVKKNDALTPVKMNAFTSSNAVYQILAAAFKDAGIDPNSGMEKNTPVENIDKLIDALRRYMPQFQGSLSTLMGSLKKIPQ